MLNWWCACLELLRVIFVPTWSESAWARTVAHRVQAHPVTTNMIARTSVSVCACISLVGLPP